LENLEGAYGGSQRRTGRKDQKSVFGGGAEKISKKRVERWRSSAGEGNVVRRLVEGEE